MTRKIRIIIDGEVLVMPHFSGIGHYTLELLRALDRELGQNQHLKVWLFVQFRGFARARSFSFKNIRIVPSPFSMRIANALKIRGLQPPLDLLFGKGVYLFPNFSSWPLLYSKSIPIIYDLSFEKYPEFADPRNQAFLSTQVRKSANRASKIVTISSNSQSEISSFYNVIPDNINVIYPAVDRSRYFPRSKEVIAKTLAKYSLPRGYILFVGNIEPRKNLKKLLLAYKLLPIELRMQHPLVLVGAKGWQDDEIFSIIKQLLKEGNEIVLPSAYVDDNDLPAIYSGATIFVYPSIYEGFGIPPIEAMSCGVPVVSANNSSLPEAVGGAAILVDALSAADISRGMKKLLVNPGLRDKYSKRGLRHVSRFSWDISAKKLLDLVQKVA